MTYDVFVGTLNLA